MPPGQYITGNKTIPSHVARMDSNLSEPGSNPHLPTAISLTDEIVVTAKADSLPKSPTLCLNKDKEHAIDSSRNELTAGSQNLYSPMSRWRTGKGVFSGLDFVSSRRPPIRVSRRRGYKIIILSRAREYWSLRGNGWMSPLWISRHAQPGSSLS